MIAELFNFAAWGWGDYVACVLMLVIVTRWLTLENVLRTLASDRSRSDRIESDRRTLDWLWRECRTRSEEVRHLHRACRRKNVRLKARRDAEPAPPAGGRQGGGGAEP